MAKKDLFKELKTSLQDIKEYEKGKFTLKNITVKKVERKILTADEIGTKHK